MSRRWKQTSSTAGLFLLALTAAAAAVAATSSGAVDTGVAAFAVSPGTLPKGVTAGSSAGTGSTWQFSRHFGGTLVGSAESGSRGLVVDRHSKSVVGVRSIKSFRRSSWCSRSGSSSSGSSSSSSSSSTGTNNSRTSRSGRRRSRASSWVPTAMSAAETTAEAMAFSTDAGIVSSEEEKVEEEEEEEDESLIPSSGETPPGWETGGGGRGGTKLLRKAGDVAKEGFTGTRRGFHLLKVYDVPDVAPTNLPEGEDEGYPMLIYQFMHAQYREEFPSQSSARKMVRRKELLLNGEEVRNDAKVKPGDEVTMQKRVQPGLFPQGKPSCSTLPIVFEDDFMAVVIKPPGVAVHGGTGKDDPGPGGRRSVRQSLPYVLAPTKSQDRPLHRPVHCHRLDKPTSGLLVCAKTRPALTAICEAFEKRLISKRYVALVAGELEGSGAIVTPLGGKACETNYRVRGEPVRSLKTPVITTVDLWPLTGRFHQLRRHLASIGCPILGDERYTPEGFPIQDGGLFLTAVGLTLPHPITGEELNFSIPEPEKYEKWRQKEQKRWLKHHHSDAASDGEEGVDANGEAAKRGRTETGTGEESVAGGQEKLSVNAVPDVEGLQLQERDGFRYYQYDWGVVGGPPTALSLEGIDDTMETP